MAAEQTERLEAEREAEQAQAAASAPAGAPGTESRLGAGEGRDAPQLTVRQRLAWLWRYWQPHRRVMVFLGFFTLVSASVTVAYPRVLGAVIDHFKATLGAGEADSRIGQAMLILVAILLARFVASLYPATRAMVNARLERDIREEVFGKLMRKDYRFNNRFRTGDVVTRLTDDLAEFPKIAWFACSGVFRAVESSAKLIFCLAMMFVMSWKLALLAIIPMPFMMWLFYSLRHKIRDYTEGSQKCVSRTNNLLESVFTGIRIIKAFRAEEGQRRRLAHIMRERVQVLLNLMKLEVVLHSMDTFAARVGQMVVIAFGGFLVIRGEMTVGALFAFYIYLDMLAWPMMDVPHLFMTAQQAFVSIDRVEEIRSYEVAETRGHGHAPGELEELAFEGVSFSYNGRRSVDGVSFRIRAGQRVALVGPVASGKSTVLKLIAGIMGPQEGEILINGRPLDQIEWDAYRRLIGYVPQEALLFSKSIEENVLFGRPPAIEDEAGRLLPGDRAVRNEVARRPGAGVTAMAESGRVGRPGAEQRVARRAAAEVWARRCLAVAQMEGDLRALPDGVETVVGQKGSLVSGGQKQRIAIARALAGVPQILLLDDCTAALDARNEDRFWQELEEQFGGRTCLIVSHRLATIRRADAILVFEDGRLVDQGRHDELVTRCETYREFLQTERRKEHLGVGADSGTDSGATAS
ncbi:MAG: ATP-binding cassette domain-containing protein [Candidatus Eisenbacteria bacterium]|nr:ATP-binding cassette domain-containing protein [Candidatus Eisenbacteria bacterium]